MSSEKPDAGKSVRERKCKTPVYVIPAKRELTKSNNDNITTSTVLVKHCNGKNEQYGRQKAASELKPSSSRIQNEPETAKKIKENSAVSLVNGFCADIVAPSELKIPRARQQPKPENAVAGTSKLYGKSQSTIDENKKRLSPRGKNLGATNNSNQSTVTKYHEDNFHATSSSDNRDHHHQIREYDSRTTTTKNASDRHPVHLSVVFRRSQSPPRYSQSHEQKRQQQQAIVEIMQSKSVESTPKSERDGQKKSKSDTENGNKIWPRRTALKPHESEKVETSQGSFKRRTKKSSKRHSHPTLKNDGTSSDVPKTTEADEQANAKLQNMVFENSHIALMSTALLPQKEDDKKIVAPAAVCQPVVDRYLQAPIALVHPSSKNSLQVASTLAPIEVLNWGEEMEKEEREKVDDEQPSFADRLSHIDLSAGAVKGVLHVPGGTDAIKTAEFSSKPFKPKSRGMPISTADEIRSHGRGRPCPGYRTSNQPPFLVSPGQRDRFLQAPSTSFNAAMKRPPSPAQPPPPPAKYSDDFLAKQLHVERTWLKPARQVTDYMAALVVNAHNGTFCIPEMLKLRRSVEATYRQAIFYDAEFTFSDNLEHKMWKAAFYTVIENLRCYDKAADTKFAQEMYQALRTLLDDATRFYLNFIGELEQTYDFKEKDHWTKVDDQFCSLIPDVTLAPPVISRQVKFALMSCHRFRLALGDIERYKEQTRLLNPSNTRVSTESAMLPLSCNYSAAREHYVIAVQLKPTSGRPYNQLALLAQYTRRKIDAVYYFFRSLSVSHPFATAKESMRGVFADITRRVNQFEADLKHHLDCRNKTPDIRSYSQCRQDSSQFDSDRNRVEIWLDLDSGLAVDDRQLSPCEDYELEWLKSASADYLYKRFMTYFLHVHGMLFCKLDLEQFELKAEKTLVQLQVLLSRSETPLTARHLVQMAFICLFSIQNTKDAIRSVDSGCGDTCSSVLINAVQFSLSFTALLVDGVLQALTSGRPHVLKDSRFRLMAPALRIMCLYFSNAHAHKYYSLVGYLVSLSTRRFQLDIWTQLAALANHIDKSYHPLDSFSDKKDECLSSYNLVYMPEDFSVCPFFDIFGSKPEPQKLPKQIAKQFNDLEQAGLLRLYTVTNLVACLHGGYMNEANAVIKFDQQSQCFVPVVRSPETKRCRKTSSRNFKPTSRRTAASDDEPEEEEPSVEDLLNTSADTAQDIRMLKLHKKDEEAKKRLLESEQRRLVIKISPKFLVPDTNSLIDYMSELKQLVDSKRFVLMLPATVIGELKGLATGANREWINERAQNAQDLILKVWAKQPEFSKLVRGLTTVGNVVDVEFYASETYTVKESNDDRILRCCVMFTKDDDTGRPVEIKNLKEEPITLHRKLVLLTDDRNLRLKAMSKNIPVKTVPDFLALLQPEPRRDI